MVSPARVQDTGSYRDPRAGRKRERRSRNGTHGGSQHDWPLGSAGEIGEPRDAPQLIADGGRPRCHGRRPGDHGLATAHLEAGILGVIPPRRGGLDAPRAARLRSPGLRPGCPVLTPRPRGIALIRPVEKSGVKAGSCQKKEYGLWPRLVCRNHFASMCADKRPESGGKCLTEKRPSGEFRRSRLKFGGPSRGARLDRLKPRTLPSELAGRILRRPRSLRRLDFREGRQAARNSHARSHMANSA